jgi:N-acetylglucosamine kinase-like BadF-type ATPase
MASTAYYIGVDGGGSHTALALVSHDTAGGKVTEIAAAEVWAFFEIGFCWRLICE